jgi:PIF1-like helicase/Helix-turn-helix domain
LKLFIEYQIKFSHSEQTPMKNESSTDPSVIASKFINQTNKSVFLTGKAGTGKTTFLKAIIEKTHKRTVVVAPTGIAAINAGGVTIHSQFQLPFGAFIPTNTPVPAEAKVVVNNIMSLKMHMNMSASKRQTLKALELLIIDEVSMLRADILDAMDNVLRTVRGDYMTPFGGVQVLFIGDLMQLPPVVKNEEWDILKQYYEGNFFFHAKVLQDEKPQYIELEKIYRQTDIEFINILDNLRNNRIEKADLEILNRYHKPDFKPKTEDSFITLTTHNAKAALLNQTALEDLKESPHIFKADIDGEFPPFSYPTDSELILKKGAQIIFIKNDPTGNQRFFNGKLAVVDSFEEGEIKVRFKDNNEILTVEKYEWKNRKYTVNDTTKEIEEETIGTFVQYPIKLAWAITVHKSQGLTFDRAVIDVNSAFAPGQVYVALSRLRSLDGLVLTTKFNLNVIRSDAQVIRFALNKKGLGEMTGILEVEIFMFLKEFIYKTYDLFYLLETWRRHVDTYNKSEQNSEKQKHFSWATEQYEMFEAEKTHAQSFTKQLEQVLDVSNPNLNFAFKRLKAAEDYFTEKFKFVLINTRKQRERMSKIAKTKAYVEELSDLEMIMLNKIVALNKATVLLQGILNGEEITKQHFANQNTEGVYKALYLAAQSEKANGEFPDDYEPKTKSKKEIGETYLLTFNAFASGKTPQEIATQRGMSIGTVYGHLGKFIAKGTIKISAVLAEDVLDEIMNAFRGFDGKSITGIKEKLGDKYSFDEIRLVKAYWESLKAEDIF